MLPFVTLAGSASKISHVGHSVVIKDSIIRIVRMGVNQEKREVIAELIESARNFRFCGPSDDPDEQTAVTEGYRYLIIQFKRIVGPLLSQREAAQLAAIDVEVNNIYSAYFYCVIKNKSVV
jgi:hypothetical protein